MALTSFGKAMRKLRIDRELMLKDVADGLGVTPAFLSAVESGRKPIPANLTGRVAQFLSLPTEEAAQLQQAADESSTSVQINLGFASAFDRSLAVQLARRFDVLDGIQKRQIRKIIDNEA